ncbi:MULTISPECIES: CHAT domain-containing tetratricopeptide repeat protein [unclassified Tolypothrix]|uniref:CHAT domain-containing tetratricopeptide repeat protein n=1 Tax=unclassified Tolypothrix TaxID=2649714 RepID=UPI0005EAA5EA|nr:MULTISPECIES: tetratricopeptide repeat protein [unclassified Tolypothrix]BAY95521.1 TPR domain protein [Microchaete diplosiphon NIES-3275]EKE96650.1 tetratricopeptide-repeat protein [Tolypothrix sp. PCC 7601]MBE9087318.1 CHAT domain-containing protein [Tolypothrix sp. LEGE 11397]UYD30680.1 CHAT domain-containing protein [Tolypothrix sp. PCC 7712]UYD38491.1 CHAT domain-containing protein [Tolypothrix sp. PCC 7601]
MTKHKKLPALASRAVALFFGLLLLSESTAASLGSHQVKIAQQPASTPSVPLNAEQQKLYQQGVKLFQEAQELQKKGTKEGYQQAINKYQQALKIVEEIGLKADQALINQSIGFIYFTLSDNFNALNYLSKSLGIWQELKQPIRQGELLSMIGDVYASTGNPKKAIEYLNQAKSIFLSNKKFENLATTFYSTAGAYIRLGDMKKAIDSLNEGLKIYRDILKDLSQEANTLNHIASMYSLIGETKQALKAYNEALEIQRKNNDLSAQAITLSQIAPIYAKLGERQKVISYIKEISKLQQEIKIGFTDQGIIYRNIANSYFLLGDYQDALSFYTQSKDAFEQAGNSILKSQVIGLIVSIYKNFLGDNQKALEYIGQAIKFQEENGFKGDEASSLNQQADIYALQGDYQKALDSYNKALEIERIITDTNSQARTLANIARLYSLLGDYNSSINAYNQSLDIYKKLQHIPNQAGILLNIGNLEFVYGNFEQALIAYDQALSLHRKQQDYISEVLALWGIAKTYRDKNDYIKAFEAVKHALALSQKHNYSFLEIASNGMIGSIYLTKSDYKNALDTYKKTLVSFRKIGSLNKEAETLNSISIVYEFQTEHQQAINTLNEEIKLRRTLKDDTGEAQALYLIAINQRKLGNLNAALPNIEAAIKIIENIRSNVKNSDLRTSYFATVQSYYKFKIDLLMELHKQDPSKGYNAQALETSDRSRARGLVELLTEARANIRKGANPELLAEERRIQALIDGKEKVRFEIVNSDKIKNPIFKANAEKLQTEIDQLLSQQKQLETEIRQTSSKYANLKYPQPLNLPQIQQQLDKDTLLLQYSLGSERSFLWVVSPNSLDTYELPKKAEIDKSAINLFCLISRNSSKPPSLTHQDNPCKNIKNQRIDVAAKELSQLILSPAKDKLATKRLVIVADGALQYIPFAALADVNSQPNSTPQEEKEKPKDVVCSTAGGIRVCSPVQPQSLNYQPLLVNHEIVSLPSASAIAIQRQELATRPPAPKALAILADPVYNATDTRVTNAQNKQLQKQDYLNLELEQSALKRSADILNRQGWTRLSGTRTEAETIFNLVPKSQGVQLLDFAANYTQATSSNLNQFRILHFATHGFVNDANPELSGLVLSLVNEQGKDIRGYLRLADLFNLDYPADLIVFSACETGLGKEIQGEGLVGLTRGLMYAGAERLVVSLWQVDDKGTSEFMQEFYQQMWQQNKSPNQALRAAQLKMWQQEKWRNPNYWAAFTFLGEWR